MVVFGDEIFHTMRNFLKKRDPFEPLKTSVSKVELGLIKKEERVKEHKCLAAMRSGQGGSCLTLVRW